MNEELVAKDEDQVNGDLADDNLSEAETEQPSSSRPAYLGPVLVAVGLLVIAVAGVFLDRQVWGVALFSPGPARIAFMSERDGNLEVYMMNRDGSNPLNLTNHPSADGLPLHVAGQKRMAFVSDRDTQGLDLFLMNLDGSEITKISNFADSSNLPLGWSPDGKHLAVYSDRSGSPEVYLIGIDDEEVINLSQVYNAIRFGDWSSGGERFILSSVLGSGIQLFITDLAGNEKLILTDGSYPADGPQWSPNGQKIAFMAISPGDGPIDIYVVDATGGEPINLTQSPANDTFPRWSPDGAKIVFSSDRDGNPELYVMGADGSNPTNLTNNPAQDSIQGDFSWSPDGAQILFHSDRDNGDVEVYVMNADGSNPVNLTHSPGIDFSAVWVK
ncbi:hypothetical protein ACFLXQ_06815 [Chloroflexota bacterium]